MLHLRTATQGASATIPNATRFAKIAKHRCRLSRDISGQQDPVFVLVCERSKPQTGENNRFRWRIPTIPSAPWVRHHICNVKAVLFTEKAFDVHKAYITIYLHKSLRPNNICSQKKRRSEQYHHSDSRIWSEPRAVAAIAAIKVHEWARVASQQHVLPNARCAVRVV